MPKFFYHVKVTGVDVLAFAECHMLNFFTM